VIRVDLHTEIAVGIEEEAALEKVSDAAGGLQNDGGRDITLIPQELADPVGKGDGCLIISVLSFTRHSS
jgi:hypothetical protein